MREWLRKILSADWLRKPGLLVILFAALHAFWFVDFWKPYNTAKGHHNFNADVTNYYAYLPAYFCNGGSFDFMWGTDSMYIPIGPKQSYVPKATYGMSLMYAPYFALGYKIAINQGDRPDGFSEPFATCVRWGSIAYVLLGLLLLRSLLVRYFGEKVVALTLVCVLFGSMLFNYTYVQSELTHGYLFFLFAAFLWLTDRWHGRPTFRRSALLGLVISLVSLIRPTEVYVFAFFILWNVRSWRGVAGNVRLFLSKYAHFIVMGAVAFGMWIPQLLFWKEHTGQYYYYPYMQERFYWGDPQISNILFSYRKGWITYTPVVVLAFAGFFTMRNRFPLTGRSILAVTLLTLYILSCWWDWSFGGCFGARAFCQHIAFLSIPIAAFIDHVTVGISRPVIRGLSTLAMIVFIFSCVCLNIGQTYQSLKGLIHPWATTKELYWFVFRKYQFDENYPAEYWSRLKFIDHEKWMRGEGRDDD